MTSCSPAEWGLSRDGLCRARTGAPRWGDPNPPPQTQGPRRGHVEYWKAQCEETRMLRLEGGKERKLLPILTVFLNCCFIRSLLLLGFHPSVCGDLAKPLCLIRRSQNDREAVLASILYPIRRSQNDREAVLRRSLEHVHRLVGAYRYDSQGNQL